MVGVTNEKMKAGCLKIARINQKFAKLYGKKTDKEAKKTGLIKKIEQLKSENEKIRTRNFATKKRLIEVETFRN